MTAERWRLVYDGACGFCRWAAARIKRLDRRGMISPIALADPAIPDLLAGLSDAERAGSWHLISPRGEVLSAGAAVGPLLRLLPAGRLIAWIPEATPRTTERVYRWIARNRATFGAWLGEERCEVIPGDGLTR